MVSVAAAVRDALGDAAGAAHVRAEGASLLVAPGSEEEVSRVLAVCTRESLAVLPRGGGTKLDWGAPPSRCDVVLSTARLDAVVEHEPGDLVCVVQPGVRLAALQDALAPHRQGLMLDPGDGVAATVGGIVAAGAWGPLRTRFGTARDLVIGMRFVLGDGTVGHSGGKVVKNVAGYDVGKLMIGSLGTLGVITEVALRLHPLPHAARTVVFDGLTAETASELTDAVLAAPVVPAAVVLRWPDGVLRVRVEGTEAGVEAQLAALRGLPFRSQELSDNASPDRPPVTATLAVPRTALSALLQRLDSATVLPTLGVAEAHVAPDAIPALRAHVESLGGHLTARNHNPTITDPVALDLMRSLKRSLDPTRILSPGRLLP